jgi:hypothetical protein
MAAADVGEFEYGEGKKINPDILYKKTDTWARDTMRKGLSELLEFKNKTDKALTECYDSWIEDEELSIEQRESMRRKKRRNLMRSSKGYLAGSFNLCRDVLEKHAEFYAKITFCVAVCELEAAVLELHTDNLSTLGHERMQIPFSERAQTSRSELIGDEEMREKGIITKMIGIVYAPRPDDDLFCDDSDGEGWKTD